LLAAIRWHILALQGDWGMTKATDATQIRPGSFVFGTVGSIGIAGTAGGLGLI
jgi:hypothetical protein